MTGPKACNCSVVVHVCECFIDFRRQSTCTKYCPGCTFCARAQGKTAEHNPSHRALYCNAWEDRVPFRRHRRFNTPTLHHYSKRVMSCAQNITGC